MRLVNSKTFYVKTANVAGSDPCDFTLKIPKDVLTCDENQAMRVSLTSWSVFCSWDNVTEDYNKIDINGVQINIPTGNYTFFQMADTLTEMYAIAQHPTKLVVEYLPSYNRLSFQFTATSTIEFLNESWSILGFTSGATLTGTVIQSQVAIKPRLVDSLKVALRGVVPKSYAFEIGDDGRIRNVDYLANVPITSPPYGLNVWRSLVDGDAALFVADKTIQDIRIIIYQEKEDELATFLPHSEMVIKIDTFVVNESGDMIDHLSKISEYSRLQFLQQGLAGN